MMPPKRAKPTLNLSQIVANVQPFREAKRRKLEERKKEEQRKANERLTAEFGVKGAKRVRNMNQYGSMRDVMKRQKINIKETAAAKIQRARRKQLARRQAEKNEAMNLMGRLYREGGGRRRTAATKIQAARRGQVARRQLARQKAVKTIRDRGRRAIRLRRLIGGAARNYPYRRDWDAVDVFRNQSGIVRVRRRSNGYGTKKRWASKLKPKVRERDVRRAGGMKEYMTAKHGAKNWHRYRPRGRYESTTRCEYIAPKSALLKAARARGASVRDKNTKATICAQMANGRPMGSLD